MSYAKMMKWNRKHPKGTKQWMGFSTLAPNERRRSPRESASYLEYLFELPERERIEKIKLRQDEWDAETARMLQKNPKLVLID